MKNIILACLILSSSICGAQAYIKGNNLLVTPAGRIGVGTTSPSFAITVIGTTSSSSFLGDGFLLSNLNVGGGSTSPGGGPLAVQFKSVSNTFAGDASNLAWNITNSILSVAGGSFIAGFSGKDNITSAGGFLNSGVSWIATQTAFAAFYLNAGGDSGNTDEVALFSNNGLTPGTSFSPHKVFSVKATGPSTSTVRFLDYGTGAAVFDQLGNINSVASGANGNVLTSNGTTWVSQAPSGGGTPSNFTFTNSSQNWNLGGFNSGVNSGPTLAGNVFGTNFPTTKVFFGSIDYTGTTSQTSDIYVLTGDITNAGNSSSAGTLNLLGGNTSGSGFGGTVVIQGGAASGTGFGGALSMTAGSSVSNAGGVASLTGGTSASGAGGALTLAGGPGSIGGSVSISSGGVGVTSGNILINVGNGTTTPGSFALVGGGTTSPNSNAGNITLTAGTASGTGTGIGGSIVLQGGLSNGAAAGTIQIKGTHLVGIGTPTPTINSCGSAPAGSIAGQDIVGKITVGGGVVTTCSITFGQTWVNAPVCVVNDQSSVVALQASSTTSGLTITSAASVSGMSIGYICLGYQ